MTLHLNNGVGSLGVRLPPASADVAVMTQGRSLFVGMECARAHSHAVTEIIVAAVGQGVVLHDANGEVCC